MKNDVEFTILMPCLNEETTLGECITKAYDSIKKNKISAEVLIADNGSTDNSKKIASQLNARVIEVEEKGYGAALREGIKKANGKYIIMGDSDCSYDFGELNLFIQKLREGFELVMGNRFKGGIKKGAMPLLHRYFGNPAITFIGKLFFKATIGDFNCGLRGFNRQSILLTNLNSSGMEFASEMVVRSTLNKLKITEVPTILHPDKRNRPPHLNTWNDGWRNLRFILIYSPRWLFMYPGLFMLLFGFILTVMLIINTISINHVNFDIHTLLYTAMFFYTGYQFVTFYIFTRHYGIKNGFLPGSDKFKRLTKLLSLERGLLIGGILFITSIVLSFYALSIWRQNDFGMLNPSQVLRIVIPAVFLFILSLQILLNSFFFGILRLGTNHR